MIAPERAEVLARTLAHIVLYLFFAAVMIRFGTALVLDTIASLNVWRAARAWNAKHYAAEAEQLARSFQSDQSRAPNTGADVASVVAGIRSDGMHIEFHRADGETFTRPMGALCDRPPAGWACPRVRGHAGPCPAYPLDS